MKKTSTGFIIGLIFIVLGILYAGSALDIFEFSIFFDGWWTLFIIVPCFYGLFKKGEDKTGCVIGLIIGLAFLINAQDISLHINFLPLIVAILCIWIGMKLILPKKEGRGPKIEVIYNGETKEKNVNINLNQREFDGKYHKDSRGYVNASAIFSGKDIRLDNEVFSGGELCALFGGIEIDLRNAVFTEDVTLDVTAIFGGIDIYVPADVRVVTDGVTPIFGGVEMSRKSNGSVNEVMPTLRLTGSCVFGGVEIH